MGRFFWEGNEAVQCVTYRVNVWQEVPEIYIQLPFDFGPQQLNGNVAMSYYDL